MTTSNPRAVAVQDLQGNIVRPYGFGLVRHVLLGVADAVKTRAALHRLLPLVTTGADWGQAKPRATLNIALSYAGLVAMGVPRASRDSFPYAFRAGMKRRALILGDTGACAPESWDPPWRENVHAIVTIHANLPADLDPAEARVLASLEGGFVVLGKEDGGVLVVEGQPTRKEHFGYTDGIAQTEIEGFGSPKTKGDGNPAENKGWTSVAAGELLFGYKDGADEYAAPPTPLELADNGTFLVFRKLHQHVDRFRDYLEQHAKVYPGGKEKLAAKFVGRWRDGTPLVSSPDRPDPELAADELRNNDFRYDEDRDGARCPLGAHIRRARPRDAQGFGGRLANTRRIMRRGLPYGTWVPEGERAGSSPRGVLFYAFNVDIEKQFEFVQQQWLNYGNHFQQGNDKDILMGDHTGAGKAVIQADAPGKPPYLCTELQRFVDVRGGEYFFVPGMRALEWLADAPLDA